MGIKQLSWGVALIAALALAACGPKAGEGGSSTAAPGAASSESSASAGGGGFFGAGKASYKAKYQMAAGPGGAMTVYASGGKTRSELEMMKATTGRTIVSLIDPVSKEYYTFQTGPGAPQTATKISADDIKKNPLNVDANWKPSKVGTDTVIGMSCNIWQMPSTDPAKPGLQMCMTDDGIMLRSGAADKPVLVATEVVKGPQDASLFALPAGYTVVDMGDCMGIMQQYAEAMKNGGEKPDKAKMMDCQKKMMAQMGAP